MNIALKWVGIPSSVLQNGLSMLMSLPIFNKKIPKNLSEVWFYKRSQKQEDACTRFATMTAALEVDSKKRKKRPSKVKEIAAPQNQMTGGPTASAVADEASAPAPSSSESVMASALDQQPEEPAPPPHSPPHPQPPMDTSADSSPIDVDQPPATSSETSQQQPHATLGEAETTVSVAPRRARLSVDSSINVSPLVSLQLTVTVFYVRAIRGNGMDVVVQLDDKYYHIDLILNFRDCASGFGDRLLYVRQHFQSNDSCAHCDCQNHSSHGQAPCPAITSLSDLFANFTTADQLAVQVMDNSTEPVMAHVPDKCWSVVANDCAIVTKVNSNGSSHLKCHGVNAECRRGDSDCGHRKAVQHEDQQDEIDKDLCANCIGTSLPVQFDPELNDFVPRNLKRLSRNRHPKLYPDKIDLKFPLMQPVSLAGWTAANTKGEVPLVDGSRSAGCGCGEPKQVLCRCTIADVTGFAVIDIHICINCSLPLTSPDEEYDLYLGTVMAAKAGGSWKYDCFGISVALSRSFIYDLQYATNMSRIHTHLQGILETNKRPSPYNQGVAIFQAVRYNYVHLRDTVLSCAAQFRIMTLLKSEQGSCYRYHGELGPRKIAVDGFFGGATIAAINHHESVLRRG